MMKPFIVIILIFRRRYQVQDSPSWLPHTKIMQHSGRPSFVSLMLLYECRGWLNHTCISWHSGTEVCLCLSNEADADGFILWLVGFFHKVCLRKRIIFALTLECQLSKLDFLWICIYNRDEIDGDGTRSPASSGGKMNRRAGSGKCLAQWFLAISKLPVAHVRTCAVADFFTPFMERSPHMFPMRACFSS